MSIIWEVQVAVQIMAVDRVAHFRQWILCVFVVTVQMCADYMGCLPSGLLQKSEAWVFCIKFYLTRIETFLNTACASRSYWL